MQASLINNGSEIFCKKAETFDFSFINSMNNMARTLAPEVVPKNCPKYCFRNTGL